MKKTLLMCLAAGITLSLAACSANPNPQPEPDPEPEFERVEIEKDTPQEWIDLFTFTNVTIVCKDTMLLRGEGREYRCVDSKWWVKDQGEDHFVEFKEDPASIYQIAYSHYSKFTHNEDALRYEAEKMQIDNTQYRYDVTVSYNFVETKKLITWLNADIYVSDSLSIQSSLEFKNYGITTITQ